MKHNKTFLANLPHYPGVYQMLDELGNVIYVGKAKDLKKRITSYYSGRGHDLKTLSLLKHIKDIDITTTNSETEAVLLECNLIKKHRPRYNVLLRDDKSYPYIIITTQHAYPRIDLYRGARKKNASYFGPYPSAYAVRETISLLQKIFRIRTCTDPFFAARTRPCLLYQIGRCTGPCVALISHEDYAHNVQFAIRFLQGKSQEVLYELEHRMKEASQKLNYEAAADLRDQITRLRQIQEKQYINLSEGNADIIGYSMQAGIVCIQLLTIRNGQVLGSRAYFPSVPRYSKMDEVISSFLSQHYLSHPSHRENIPKAILVNGAIKNKTLLTLTLSEQSGHKVTIMQPLRGDKRKWLLMATESAKQSLIAHLFNQSNFEERMDALKTVLQLKLPPLRIECFDVSHSMGEATVASCVVFNQNGPIKSEYRRFNIEHITPGDDVAAIYQVILRRFKRLQKEQIKLPEVVLIDGGRTQLSAASKAIKELQIQDLFLVGISKGPARKPGFETLHFLTSPPMHLPADSVALHFIQQIRDEAHRFAITGHRQKRDKVRRKSSLEYIPGIGVKRRRELLRYFGGIQGLLHASLDELANVPGISRSLAEKIFTMLHDATL